MRCQTCYNFLGQKFHFMIIFNKITHLQALTGQERAELALALDDLRRLEQVIHRTKRTPKRAYRPSKLATRPKTDLVINGVRVCHLCKRPIPHRAKTDHQYHMLAAKRRWMQQASQRRYAIIGYERLWQAGQVAWRRTFIERRMVIFREVAPKTLEKVGRAGAERIIDSARRGVSRMPYDSDRFRAWLRRRYA